MFFLFSVSGHVVATQTAVDAVLSAAKEESKQSRSGEESVEGEPQEKRQALEVDLSSLVKEAVFDGQQVWCRIQLLSLKSCTRVGARFSKVAIINGPAKPLLIMCKMKFSSWASNMIKLSVNKTKCSSLLARALAFILYISIRMFDFGPEKLPGLSRNGPLTPSRICLAFTTE